MTMMAFKIGSVGYSSFSAGRLYVAFTVAGGHQLYRWTGTGSSSVFASVFCAPIVVPYNRILHNFTGQYAKFTLKGGVVGWGSTELGFSIRYSGGSRAEAYNIAPSAPDNMIGVEVRGSIVDDIECYGMYSIVSGSERDLLLEDLFGIPNRGWRDYPE